MWADIGLWVLGIVGFSVVIYILAIPLAFMLDRWFSADPSGTEVITAVTAARVKHDAGRWQYNLVWSAGHTGKDHVENPKDAKLNPERRKAYLVDPGILAYWTQFQPMFPALGEEYDIYVLNYADGLLYDRKRLTAWVALFAQELLNVYGDQNVVYDGISHGGIHAFYVGEALGENVKKLSRVALHDPPSGQKTMKPGLNLLPSFVGRLFLFTPGRSVNGLLGWAIKAMLAMPNRKNVSLPNAENLAALGLPADTSEDEYFDYVCEQAKANLSGHKFSLWYSELGDIIRAGREMKRGTFPFHVFDAVPVVYIRYVERNATVQQPKASYVFCKEMPNMRVLDIPGTHAGFLENYDDNVAVQRQALTVPMPVQPQ